MTGAGVSGAGVADAVKGAGVVTDAGVTGSGVGGATSQVHTRCVVEYEKLHLTVPGTPMYPRQSPVEGSYAGWSSAHHWRGLKVVQVTLTSLNTFGESFVTMTGLQIMPWAKQVSSQLAPMEPRKRKEEVGTVTGTGVPGAGVSGTGVGGSGVGGL